MKKSLPIVLAFALFAFIGSSALAQTFDYPVKGKQGFNLTEKTRDGLHITYNVGQVTLNQLNYRGEDMCEVSISSVSLPNDEGMPNLPADDHIPRKKDEIGFQGTKISQQRFVVFSVFPVVDIGNDCDPDIVADF